MTIRLACILSCLAPAVLAPVAAVAQEADHNVTIVEILGLRSWTREMVADSVAKYAPGVSLEDHACAVILRDSVGFADAASISLSFGGDTTWTVLPVVEPELGELVRFRAYAVKRARLEEWSDIFEILEGDPRAMNPLQHPEVLLEGADTFFDSPVAPVALELRRTIRAHATPENWELARSTILTDSSPTNRAVAALVLSNFPDRDSTFYLLAEGLRATDSGASAAEMVLSALVRGAPRAVDWAPARDALEALVGGTNLFAYTDVLHALVETEIDPRIGRELARLNPVLLLDHVGARNPMSPRAAHRFLAHVSGHDHGRDRAAWEEWLTSATGPHEDPGVDRRTPRPVD